MVSATTGSKVQNESHQVSPKEVAVIEPDLYLEVIVSQSTKFLAVDVPVGEIDRGPVAYIYTSVKYKKLH